MSTAPVSFPFGFDSQIPSNPPNLHLMVLKPVAKTIDWAEFFTSNIPKPVREAHAMIGKTRDGLSLLDLRMDIKDLFDSLASLRKGVTFEKSVETFENSIAVTETGITVLERLDEYDFIDLSDRQVNLINGIDFLSWVSVFLSSFLGIKKNLIRLTQSRIGGPEFNNAFINVGIKVCAIVSAIFGMIVFLASGDVVSKVTLLGVSSVGLIFKLSRYYYNNILA